MITSSPGLSVAISALYSTCLPPVPTMIWFGLYVRPFSRWNLAMIAAFSSGMPPTSVYLVLPASMARIAASLMLAGVSKSGSPAPSPMTLRPAAFSARALSVTAMVADGLTRSSAAASRGSVIGGGTICFAVAPRQRISTFSIVRHLRDASASASLFGRVVGGQAGRETSKQRKPDVQTLFDAALRQQLQGPPCAGP